MIEQIDDYLFERFDNAEGDQKLYTTRTLVIAYAHKIRELVNQVNALTEELSWKEK